MATKKLTCTADVSISQKYSGQAYNSAGRLAFGSGSSSSDAYYVLLNFSSLGLSSTAYKVTKAVLTITKIDGAIGYNASFYARALRVTSSWSESTTYDTQPSVTTTGASASVSMGTGHSGSVSLDITSIVQSWLAGSAQYGVRLEKTTSGTSLLKCIADRTSSSAAYITVTYEAKAPAPTTPAVTAPGTVTTDSKTFSWTASADHIYASSSLSYQLQVSLDGGSTWGSTYTASAGKTSLAVNLRTVAGLSSGQYYYNAGLKVRVRAVTPSYNGTVYYSSWGTSANGVINYKITPTKPSSLAVSPSSAYEGAAVTVTLGRPSSYNTLTSGGATNTLTYYVKLASGSTLGSVKAAVTSATASLTVTLGSLTSGKANLSTSITAYCVDAHSQTSPSTSAVSLTVNRYRAPVISITGIDRAAESATATAAVTDTGYGGTQSNGQISAVEYTIDGGATWATITPAWVGLKTAVEITGLSANTRYTLQVRVTNVAPDGLAAKSVTYTATIFEYTPAAMIFRDSANDATGIAAKSLIVGEDWSSQVAEGDASIEGTIYEGGAALVNKYARQYSKINNANYWGVNLPDGTETGYLRAPSEGIIPNVADSAGHGYLGTSSWPWANLYVNKINGYGPWHKGNLPYETGAWTPSFGVTDSSATAPTVSYTYQYGRYIRIGRLVFVNFRIQAAITAAGTGYALINGLPYTFGGNGYHYIGLSENSGGFSSTPNTAFVFRGAYIRIQAQTGTSAVKFVTASVMYLSGSGCYELSE